MFYFSSRTSSATGGWHVSVTRLAIAAVAASAAVVASARPVDAGPVLGAGPVPGTCNNGQQMLTAKAVVSGSMQHIGPFDVSYYLMSNWGEFTDVGGTVSAAPFASEYCGSCSMPVVPDKPTCMFASWTNRMQIQGEWGPADDYGVNGWYFRDGIVNFAISFFREWQAANARRVGTHVSVDCGERFAAGNTTKAPPRTACVCEPDQWAQSFSVPASVRFVLWNNCVGAQAGYLEFSFTGQPQMSAPDSCPMFTAMFGTAAALGMPASQGAVSSAIQLFCGAQQLAGTMRLGL